MTQEYAHAYILEGKSGETRDEYIRSFAGNIICPNADEFGHACGRCPACVRVRSGTHEDLFYMNQSGKDMYRVEDAADMMERLSMRPYGEHNVGVVDNAERLSEIVQNKLLKTLEEPPAHVIFILATTEKHKILPTILSRCQIYDFERMTVPNIINHLKAVAEKENIQYEEQALNIIAEKADGGMRDALSIFDQAASFSQGNITYQKVIEDLNVLDEDNYFNIINLALENKVSDIMVLLNNVINKGFDGGHLINGLASHVRNVLMAKDAQTLPLLEVSDQQRKRYQEQAQKCPTLFLYNALKIMNRCDVEYRQSSNKRLTHAHPSSADNTKGR